MVRARGTASDHLLCLDLSDLPLVAQALLLRLDPVHDPDEYSALRRVTASLAVPYSVADVRSAAAADPATARLATRIDNLGIAAWELWRRGDERSAAELDLTAGRCFVIDLGSRNSPGERAAVSLGLLGRLWMLRRRRLPMLLVVDEAHNILPSVTADPLSSSTADLGGAHRRRGPQVRAAPVRRHAAPREGASERRVPVRQPVADAHERQHRHRGARTPVLARPAGDAAPRHDVRAGPGPLRGTDRPDPLLARVGTRVSPEGGADVPTDWAHPAADTGVLTYPHEGPESS
ncbi:hypothetical protein ACWPOB_14235 [Rhodococcus sp. 2H158]